MRGVCCDGVVGVWTHRFLRECILRWEIFLFASASVGGGRGFLETNAVRQRALWIFFAIAAAVTGVWTRLLYLDVNRTRGRSICENNDSFSKKKQVRILILHSYMPCYLVGICKLVGIAPSLLYQRHRRPALLVADSQSSIRLSSLGTTGACCGAVGKLSCP